MKRRKKRRAQDDYVMMMTIDNIIEMMDQNDMRDFRDRFAQMV